MGLAASQARLLTLTARKSDCEYNISIDSAEKMSLAREQTQLSQEYAARLKAKNVCYYANGQYNKMTYEYLMGYCGNWMSLKDGTPLKSDSSMILTDYNGLVVMNKGYADAMLKVLGSSALDGNGRGGTFSLDKIPEIMAAIYIGYSADDFRSIMQNNETSSTSFNVHYNSQVTGQSTGNSGTIDNTAYTSDKTRMMFDFMYPILLAAATNGWTTEYNNAMNTNDDYINESIINGTFQLATVTDNGRYDMDTSLTYYITHGLVQTYSDSSAKEEVTAWYTAEKNRIAEKESYIDLDLQNLSTELEAIKTEIQAVQSLIDDDMSAFEWGQG